MRTDDPRSWLDRVVGACLSVLIAAIALYCASQVLQSVLPFLVTVAGVGVFAWAGWWLWRYVRNRY